MKLNILFTVVLLLFLVACGDTSHKEKDTTLSTNADIKENKTSLSVESIKDCEDFIDTYEEWSDQLLTIMAKYKENPVGLATSSEYINTMTKGVNFIQDWETIAFSCASNPTYETRMRAIQEKMEARQKELGFK